MRYLATFLLSPIPALAVIATGFAEQAPVGFGFDYLEAEKAAGQKVFKNRCAACHASKRPVFGPSLNGVAGRAAGSVARFPYPDAPKKSGLIWAEENLAVPRYYLSARRRPTSCPRRDLHPGVGLADGTFDFRHLCADRSATEFCQYYRSAGALRHGGGVQRLFRDDMAIGFDESARAQSRPRGTVQRIDDGDRSRRAVALGSPRYGQHGQSPANFFPGMGPRNRAHVRAGPARIAVASKRRRRSKYVRMFSPPRKSLCKQAGYIGNAHSPDSAAPRAVAGAVPRFIQRKRRIQNMNRFGRFSEKPGNACC